jgi:lambda repressor-like predicted transcriptional regulator
MSEETLSELRACGSVLNQLARRANMSEKIDPQELRNALRHWGEIVEKILASPTRKPMEEELQDDDGDFNEWAESIEKIELEIEREMTK